MCTVYDVGLVLWEGLEFERIYLKFDSVSRQG